jgi:hypothetical protein
MTSLNNDIANRELSLEELDAVAAGEFSWGALGKAMAAGAVTGGLGGSVVGGVGAGPGAVGGGLLAGIGYCISSIF